MFCVKGVLCDLCDLPCNLCDLYLGELAVDHFVKCSTPARASWLYSLTSLTTGLAEPLPPVLLHVTPNAQTLADSFVAATYMSSRSLCMHYSSLCINSDVVCVGATECQEWHFLCYLGMLT